MNFKLPQLQVEHMMEVIHFHGSIMECSEWVQSLPEELRIYAVDAVYKAGENLVNQRNTEANRRIFIQSILQEMRATAHDHFCHGVKDSALIKVLE